MSETEAINLFRTTYNALYVKNLSSEKKMEITNDNPVLRRLVNNLDSFPPPPKYIEGPNSFYIITLGVKTFYLFGEMHSDEQPFEGDEELVDFTDYIGILSEHSPSFTDIYVELPMLDPHRDEGKAELDREVGNSITTGFAIQNTIEKMIEYGYHHGLDTFDFEAVLQSELRGEGGEEGESRILESILEEYKDCIQPSGRSIPKCELIRIHNIDIRTNWKNIPSIETNYHFYIKVIYLTLKICETTEQRIKILNRLGKPVQKVLEAFTSKRIVDSVVNLFKTNPSIKKEIDERTYMELPITQFIKYKLDQLLGDDAVHVFRRFKRAVDNVTPIDDSDVHLVYDILFEASILSMDLYALSRIFKEYRPKRSSDNPFQPIESINIIVYAGIDHIQNYREFLVSNQIGGEEVYRYENPNEEGGYIMMKK